MTRTGRLAAALLPVFAFVSFSAVAQSAGAKTQFRKMITAVEKGDYDSFVENAEPTFRAELPKVTFNTGTLTIFVRMKSGYTSSYLGTLSKGGYSVSYWKLVIKDGKDDVLVSMAMKNGKVGAFAMN